MTIEVGEVVVDGSGNATGYGLSFKIYEEILAEIDADAARAVAAKVGPFCEGFARALLYGDGVDALMIPRLTEFHACSLELLPGGSPIFSGAQNSSQGIAWVRVEGVANLFLAQRTYGSGPTQLTRIVRFVYADDGSTITHTEYSEELTIGHGQSLTAFADGSTITLYCSNPDQDGFTRIAWNGSSTSQSDVDDISVLPATGELSRYNGVTPCVSQDGEKLLLSANDTKTEDEADTSKTVLVYLLSEVLEEYEAPGGDPTTLIPITIIPRPPLRMSEGHIQQGIVATSDYIYQVVGFYEPFAEKGVMIFDYAGNLVRVISLAGSLANYTLEDLYDHGSYGIPMQFEFEDLTLTDDGAILCCMCESWLTTTDIVTFEGNNYAAIRDASGVDQSPRMERLWVRTDKAANQGAWDASTSYTAGEIKSRIVKEVWGLRQASPVGATGESQLNANVYFRPSGAWLSHGLSGVDLSYPAGSTYQIKEWSPNIEAYVNSVDFTSRGLRVYDSRADTDSGNDHYFYLAAENRGGREYSYARAAGGELDSGAGINLYGSDDSEYPDVARIYQGGGEYFIDLGGGVLSEGGGVTLGDESNPWPESYVATGYFVGNVTGSMGSAETASREYLYIRAADVLADGAGINLYGHSDASYPDVARIYQGGGSRYVEINGGVFRQDGSTKLGESVRKWPEAWVDMLMLTWTSVANMPSASSYPGGVMLCSNGDSGGPCLAVAYGTYWYRVSLGAVISAT